MLNYDSMSNQSWALFTAASGLFFIALTSASVAMNHLWRSAWYAELKNASEDGEGFVGFLPPFWYGLMSLFDYASMGLAVFFLINQYEETPGVHHSGEKSLLLGFLFAGVYGKLSHLVSLSVIVNLGYAAFFSSVNLVANVGAFIMAMYLCSLDSPRNIEFDSPGPWFVLYQCIWGVYTFTISVQMAMRAHELQDVEPNFSHAWNGKVVPNESYLQVSPLNTNQVQQQQLQQRQISTQPNVVIPINPAGCYYPNTKKNNK